MHALLFTDCSGYVHACFVFDALYQSIELYRRVVQVFACCYCAVKFKAVFMFICFVSTTQTTHSLTHSLTHTVGALYRRVTQLFSCCYFASQFEAVLAL